MLQTKGMTLSLFNYVQQRGLGRPVVVGQQDRIRASLYSSVAPIQITDSAPCDGLDWGAVFGFGFSPDGSLLAAACENRCMLLYDPNNARLITRRFQTHTDCVNCIRFLDNRTFATCSDDHTVRLWDARFLKSEVRILRGHRNWVKNIEYCSHKGKLITSGFDGNIFGWDINNFSEGSAAEPLFYMTGMMRTKLDVRENTMIISTQGGYFILIHDLELDRLREDLSGFKPHVYRLMQLTNTPLEQHVSHHKHVFSRSRNRVEFVCDFPEADTAESISTMQVHPQGWCIVSRNTSHDEESEWTCVHDIQQFEHKYQHEVNHQRKDSASPSAVNTKTGPEDSYSHPATDSSTRERQAATLQYSMLAQSILEYSPLLLGLSRLRGSFMLDDGLWNESPDESSSSDSTLSSNNDDEDDLDSEDNNEEDLEIEEMSPQQPLFHHSDSSFRSSTSSQDFSDSVVASDEFNNIENSLLFGAVNIPTTSSSGDTATQRHVSNRHDSAATDEHEHITSSLHFSEQSRTTFRTQLSEDSSIFSDRTLGNTNHSCGQNHTKTARSVGSRLLFYSEEPNVGRGFIKEQSFSADGRVIASPFGNCVRLLAFNPGCSELCDCVSARPTVLTQVALTDSHRSNILASTFSPTHLLLVAGARDGSISFCYPKL